MSLKKKQIVLGVLALLFVSITQSKSWAAPVNENGEYKKLEEKVNSVEKKLDNVSIESVVKSYKDSESSLYEASSKTITFANLIIVGMGALTAIKYGKDNIETKKMTKFMDESKEDFKLYKEKLEKYESENIKLQSKLKKYKEEIDKSKSEIEELKNKTESYANQAKEFADKSELETLKKHFNIEAVSSENKKLEEYKFINNNLDIQESSIENDTFSPKEGLELLHKANKYKEEKDFDSAINIYKQLARLDKKNACEFYTRIGTILSDQGNANGAFKYYNLAERINPNNDFLIFCKAGTYSKVGKHDKALKLYYNLLDSDTYENKDALYLFIGFEYEHLGNYEEAKKYYEKYNYHNNNKLVAVTE